MYPKYLDENVIRPIAGIVFSISLITILKPETSWLMYPLFFDFLIRFINPKFSPIVLIIKLFNKNILNIKVLPYYSAPKRFAILIGVIFTTIISITIFFNFIIIQSIFTYLLLIAASFQGFFGYCIGCEIYNFFIKIGIFKHNTKIDPLKSQKYINH